PADLSGKQQSIDASAATIAVLVGITAQALPDDFVSLVIHDRYHVFRLYMMLLQPSSTPCQNSQNYFKCAFKNAPVCDSLQSTNSSGVPAKTRFPPPSPPSGPISITQSADLIISMLCSITKMLFPKAMSASNEASSLRMS